MSPALPTEFAPRIAAYWPGVTPEMLTPGYSGVRPKIGGPKDPNADFRIDGPKPMALPAWSICSASNCPGLTASLAIAEKVEEMLRDA